MVVPIPSALRPTIRQLFSARALNWLAVAGRGFGARGPKSGRAIHSSMNRRCVPSRPQFLVRRLRHEICQPRGPACTPAHSAHTCLLLPCCVRSPPFVLEPFRILFEKNQGPPYGLAKNI